MGAKIKIDIDLLNKKEEIPHSVQFIPADSQFYDGTNDGEIRQRFTQEIRKNPDLKASLRGRPLDGVVMTLPEDYVGLVLNGGRAEGLSERSERDLRAVKSMDKVTYWNYDRIPSKDDQFSKSLQWINIAKALHN